MVERGQIDGYRINIATRGRGEKEEVDEPRGNNFFKRASMAISTAFGLQDWHLTLRTEKASNKNTKKILFSEI